MALPPTGVGEGMTMKKQDRLRDSLAGWTLFLRAAVDYATEAMNRFAKGVEELNLPRTKPKYIMTWQDYFIFAVVALMCLTGFGVLLRLLVRFLVGLIPP